MSRLLTFEKEISIFEILDREKRIPKLFFSIIHEKKMKKFSTKLVSKRGSQPKKIV